MNALWAQTLLGALREAGADCVVASPGSRSTPLLCAADRLSLPIHVAIDERSAAFFAVGRAKLSGRPPLLVCTSGTAAAHYYPAIIEAAYSRVPVIAVTADRPPELSHCAAPQTIDQLRLFGTHARAFFDLGLPNDAAAALNAVRRKAAQAVAASLGPDPGPVHVNVPARKPLEPCEDESVADTGGRIAKHFAPAAVATPRAIDALARACDSARRGLIVSGPAPVSAVAARAAVDGLAARTGFPLWCEATSQMRFRGDAIPAHCCDALDHVADSLPGADVIVELWGTPTSAAYQRYLRAHPGARRWVVTPHGWRDAHSSAEGIVNAEVGDTLSRVAAAVHGRADRDFTESVLAANRAGRAAAEASAVLEDRAIRAAVSAIPSGGLLAVGNSKPVRTLDRFVSGSDCDAAVWCQRGANGIDGLVAGAAGAASVSDRGPLTSRGAFRRSRDRPVLLVLGDVSFAHDVGGLALARATGAPLAILVVDNGGGKIFEQLPIRDVESVADSFERLWLTPPRLDVAAAAAAYGITSATVSDPGGVSRAVVAALSSPGCTVIHAEVA